MSYCFRETDSSADYAHVIFAKGDSVRREYLESESFKTKEEARNFLLDKDGVFIALYAGFGAYYFLKPSSIEMVVPDRYFVKHRRGTKDYEWVELKLVCYDEIIYDEIKEIS